MATKLGAMSSQWDADWMDDLGLVWMTSRLQSVTPHLSANAMSYRLADPKNT